MSKHGKEQHSTCCLGTSQAERREQHSPKGCSMATVPSTSNKPFCSDKGAWTGAARTQPGALRFYYSSGLVYPIPLLLQPPPSTEPPRLTA